MAGVIFGASAWWLPTTPVPAPKSAIDVSANWHPNSRLVDPSEANIHLTLRSIRTRRPTIQYRTHLSNTREMPADRHCAMTAPSRTHPAAERAAITEGKADTNARSILIFRLLLPHHEHRGRARHEVDVQHVLVCLGIGCLLRT